VAVTRSSSPRHRRRRRVRHTRARYLPRPGWRSRAASYYGRQQRDFGHAVPSGNAFGIGFLVAQCRRLSTGHLRHHREHAGRRMRTGIQGGDSSSSLGRFAFPSTSVRSFNLLIASPVRLNSIPIANGSIRAVVLT